jgi:hypothetical protein
MRLVVVAAAVYGLIRFRAPFEVALAVLAAAPLALATERLGRGPRQEAMGTASPPDPTTRTDVDGDEPEGRDPTTIEGERSEVDVVRRS